MDKYRRRAVTLPVSVAKSPAITAPKFGAWLQLQRGNRSLEQIAQKVRVLVRPTGLKVDQSLIYKIEQGRVPSWPLLGGLCRVYELELMEALRVLAMSVEFPGAKELLGQSDGVQHASTSLPGEGSALDDDSSTAARDLAEELRSITDAFAGAVQDVANRLLGGTAYPPPPRPVDRTGARAPGRVRGSRKTG